jgi:primase-polymerase (primpol)-like protein
VFSESDGFVGVDLDSCRNKKTGEIAAWAQQWIDRSNTYTEVSPSETGVKMWLRSDRKFVKGKNIKIDEPGFCPDKKPGVEMYSHGRYFAVTGHVVRGFQ